MNSFGTFLKFSTFGESHGKAIGVVIDNYPAGVRIDTDYINSLLKLRQGGGAFSTPRKEADEVNIISGVFNDISTGAPICVLVENNNTRSKDYKEHLRPAHADFTYYAKYEHFDYRGGGRSSARESVARVIAGAFADLILKEFNIRTYASICGVGGVSLDEFKFSEEEYKRALEKDFNALGDDLFKELFKDEITKAKNNNDSVGASVSVAAFGVMAGLGDGLYDKLDARIASAFMGLNAVKCVEIGAGRKLSSMNGSFANDEILGVSNDELMQNQNSSILKQSPNFKSFKVAKTNINKPLFLHTRHNFSGGIIGGISTGESIYIKAHFKPTPSIFKEQTMLNKDFSLIKDAIYGRHDPCVGVRGAVVLKAMLSFIIADFLMLNSSAKISNLKKIYKGE
ncbi:MULTISPECIES: chorismate synthase [unclassified Campylobacter]|uniref:chorismate synthase n=1 Tax=unclassified Campylobacter TaxID=2593542 RepID=UPI001BD9E97A|nr:MULTISPECIES: chorismate synthase [unclassified Campylobacter]MBZ7976618.1 chorismate synthase [Campylobacter sp. RM12637]MBZ7978631.1 chorismate synthase [Campylobacter sp. RM12654]MBZ7982552.1 chorismate synthase [Campylobacter sp. RM12640]MBZ7989803.1 chorismate synthase [Campylobacter sp. RM12635]MBZ7993256.1 chorismate synthase [Campylobacter sp. RM9333]